MAKMTKEQIISKLQTDWDFALRFGIDNNLPGFLEALRAKGFTGGTSDKYVYDIIVSLLNQGKKEEVIKIISSIKYLPNAPNYTGGLTDYFLRSSPPQSKADAVLSVYNRDTNFSWGGVLAGLGAGLSTFAGVALASLGIGGGQSAPSAGAADAAAAAAAAKAAKTKKILMWVGISVGGILLLTGLYFAFKPKTETAAA